VSISDNGIGIPEEKIESIFNDFYQVDGSLTRTYGGAGIGLFISKKIITTHGADIWLESKTETGTIVHVILPVNYSKKSASVIK
jgi:signal transduction histidine kinase